MHKRLPKHSLIALTISNVLSITPAYSAIINVDPPGTPNGCTLVDAINNANQDMTNNGCESGNGDDTINLPANTIFELSAELPSISSTITLNGNGNSLQPDESITSPFSLLRVMNGDLSVNSLSLLNGFAVRGAGLYASDATVTLTNSTVSNNSANSGGGIYASEFFAVSLSNTQVTGNSASKGGGIYAEETTITLTNCTVSSNSADYGGGLYADKSIVSVSNTQVTGNSALSGGGIYGNDLSSSTLKNSTLSNNTADFGGGLYAMDITISISNTMVTGNSAEFYGGGLAANESTKITLLNSTVSDNSAGTSGGGIDVENSSRVSLINSSVMGNSANDSGGGVIARRFSNIIMLDSTLSGNSASYWGGGLSTSQSNVTLTNTTVSNNLASIDGGGLSAFYSSSVGLFNSTVSSNTADDSGGGVYLGSGYVSMTIVNSTLFGNRAESNLAESGGGLFANNSAIFNVYNTVLANSFPEDCGGKKPTDSPLFGNTNWFDDSSCGGDGDAMGDPKLGPLQFNGGPTKTHAPMPGSGLEGAGEGFFCQFAAINNTDQRGETRNNPCFIGSVDDIIDATSFYVIPLADGKTVVIPL